MLQMYSLLLMLPLSAVVVGVLLWFVPTLVWGICRVIARLFHKSPPRYMPFCRVALVLVLSAWSLMAYAFFVGRFRLEVNPVRYVDASLPAPFKGYKIVHISDLHLSTFDDRPSALRRVVDSINAQKPDLICFTGDLVTIGLSEALPYTDILRRLRASDGVVSVLGNHDLLIYTRMPEPRRQREVERLVAYEREQLGWQVLRNEHITLSRDGTHIHILGVDNCSCGSEGFRTTYSGDLQAAKDGVEGFSVLLSHDPSHWRAEVWHTDIPLTLSGHTHSGQMRIGSWPLSSLLFEESAGRYVHEGRMLYVNSGVGCTLPVRLNCPAEITVITLE